MRKDFKKEGIVTEGRNPTAEEKKPDGCGGNGRHSIVFII